MFPVSDLEVVVVAVAGRRWRLYPEDVAKVNPHKVAAVGFEGAEAEHAGVRFISQTWSLNPKYMNSVVKLNHVVFHPKKRTNLIDSNSRLKNTFHVVTLGYLRGYRGL